MSSGNDDIFSDLIVGSFNQTYFFIVLYNSRMYSEKLLFKNGYENMQSKIFLFSISSESIKNH